MPSLLRRRLVCFYCGHKSSYTKNPTIRQWHCTECDAVNYLDENGEITDPPASAHADEGYKYTIEAARLVSPDLAAQPNQIFCSTCQKNQHIFVETLATYLPDPTDPRYAEYERNLPAYKRQLEERYPQVCAQCVHLVNNRIESMTYLARTENLKLTLEKTRKGLVAYRGKYSWKGAILFLGGCMWWTAVLGQFIWHLLGLTLSGDESSQASLPVCLLQSALSRRSDLSCYESMTNIVPWFLAAGWLSLWWNNKLAQAHRGLGRLTNLNDFYFSQIIFLVLRNGVFWAINSQWQSSAFPTQRIHGALVIFMIIFVISSLNIVSIKRQPTLADYKLTKVEAPASTALTLDPPKSQSHPNETPVHNNFPLSAMAPSSSGTGSVFGSKSTRRMSDSTEMSLFDRNGLQQRPFDDNSSEMDWTPTQPAFTLRQPVRSKVEDVSYTPKQSPFGHNLPAAPEHPAHKARKPPPQPVFHRAPEEQRNDFRTNINKASVFDNWGLPSEPKPEHEMAMGPSRLGLTQQETGLENLFNNVFSLQDEPRELHIAPLRPVDGIYKQKSLLASRAIWTLLFSMPVSIAAAWWLTREGSSMSWDRTAAFVDLRYES